MDRFDEHKFTLTEAHYLFHSVLPLMDKNASKLDHKELSDKLKGLNINQELTNEIKEVLNFWISHFSHKKFPPKDIFLTILIEIGKGSKSWNLETKKNFPISCSNFQLSELR